MKVSKSPLIKDVLSSREAASKLCEAVRKAQVNGTGKSSFTFKSDSGVECTVVISYVPKATGDEA